jgi:1-acyl-sn-glycerol-3-phosphate acyltransferase
MVSPYCMRSMALAKMVLKPVIDHFVKISSAGLENIPRRGPFVLASNHRSDLDPLIIGSVVPRYVAWIADSFLFKIPFVGNILQQLGTIPISTCRREQLHAFRRSHEILRAGQPIGIFPEGHDTIVRGSERILGKFQGGFAELAIRHGIPVLPVTIVPIEEESHPIQIPWFLKDWLQLPEDVAQTRQRLIYRRVHVEIGRRIDTTGYSRGTATRLVANTRITIGETFRRAYS